MSEPVKITEQLVQDIEAMGLEELRAAWRKCYGSPPTLRSAPIMRMMLSWRLQAETYGGIDAETRKALSRTGSAQPEGRELGILSLIHI